MKRYTARHILIAQLAALTLGALCFLQTQTSAQGMSGYIVIFPSVGLAHGQSLRLTLFNPDGAPVRAQARTHHSGGANFVFGDGSVRFVQPGVSHSFDFKRSDISLEGEAGTGRLQLLASVSLTFSEAIHPVVVSMEIIEVKDGTSNTIFVGEVLPSPASGGGNDILLGGDARDILMGIAPEQKLRVTLFNPPSSESGAQGGSVGGHVKVFDGSSNLIAQSPELAIPQGEFRSFDFDRNALPLLGEPGTNRAQVRIKPFFNFQSERLSPVLASFEIVDNRTGKTTVLTGHQCLVFYLGGMPEN